MHRGPSFVKACAFVLSASFMLANTVQAAEGSKLDAVLKRGNLVVGTDRKSVV